MADSKATPKLKSFKPGEVIFNEGEVGDYTYIIKQGSVKIVTQHNDKAVTLGVLKDGTCFGEMAVISDAPRVASAITETVSQIYVIDKSHIKNMMESISPLFRAIINTMIKRVRGLNAFAAEKASLTHPMISTAHLLMLIGESHNENVPQTTGGNPDGMQIGTNQPGQAPEPISNDYHIPIRIIHRQVKDILGYTDAGAHKILEKFVKLRLAKIENANRKQLFIFNPIDFVTNTREVLQFIESKGNDEPRAELEYVDLNEIAEQLDLRPQRILDAIYNGRISPDAILLRRHIVMQTIENQGRQLF